MTGKLLTLALVIGAGVLAWSDGKSDTPSPQLAAVTLPPRDYRQDILERKDSEINTLKEQLAKAATKDEALSSLSARLASLEALKDELAILQGTIDALEAEKELASPSKSQVSAAAKESNPINYAPRVPYQIEQPYTYNYGFRGRNTATGVRKVWVYDDENGVTYYCSGQSGINYGYQSGGSCGPRGCN